jgi:putative ABC transport system permease protein
VLIIFTQIQFFSGKKTGLQKDHLLLSDLPDAGSWNSGPMKEVILRLPGVVSASSASIMPPSNASSLLPILLPAGDTMELESYQVDFDFFSTLGIGFLDGREFDPALDSINGNSVILNQAAAKALDINQDSASMGIYRIVGIVKDFSVHSFHYKVNPAIFLLQPQACRELVIKYQPGTRDAVTGSLERIWNSYFPGVAFRPRQFTEELNLMYRNEKRFGQVVASFSLLAFIITGMGLFGLGLLISERRMKEIAVRKVFGASNMDLLFRIQREFLLYSAIATVVSIPATWFLMNAWLSGFQYRTGLHWYLFVVAATGVTIFVSAIIITRMWSILRKNPIHALKYE